MYVFQDIYIYREHIYKHKHTHTAPALGQLNMLAFGALVAALAVLTEVVTTACSALPPTLSMLADLASHRGGG
jgi:hypothetical protein